MTSKTPLRSCEDVDETVLSYAEVKALCIGDPRIREKMELDIEVSKLRLLEASFRNEHFATQDKLRKTFPNAIHQTEQRIALLEQDVATARRTSSSPFRMVILSETFIEDTEDSERKKEAGKALLEATRKFGIHSAAEIGLTCSVGVGYSMTSAKMASEEKSQTDYLRFPRRKLPSTSSFLWLSEGNL